MDQMRYEEVSLTQKHQGKRPEDVATRVDMMGLSDGGGGGETGDDYDKKNKEIFQAAMSSAGLSSTATLNGCSYDGQDHDSSSTEFKMANALLSKCTSSRPFKAVFFAGSADENIVFADVMQSNPGEVSFCMGGYRYTFTVNGSTVHTEKVFIGESIPETEIWDKYFQALVGVANTQLANIILPNASYTSGSSEFNVLNTIYDEVKARGSFYATWKYYKDATDDKQIVVAPVALDPSITTNTVFGIAVGNLTYAVEADAATNPSKFTIRSASDLRDSEEFKRIFDTINNNEFFLDSAAYTETGTVYTPGSAIFTAATNIYNKIKNSDGALMVPWSKLQVTPTDIEYSVVDVYLDKNDTNGLTFGFTAGCNAYKFVLDAPTPTTVTTYLVCADEDHRDSIEFDKIFKAIVQDDNFVLSELSASKAGYVYPSDSPIYRCMSFLYDKIKYNNYAIMATWSRDSFLNPDHDQIVTIPVIVDTTDSQCMVYSVGGLSYKVEMDPSETQMTVYRLESDEDTRDSFEFLKVYQELTGTNQALGEIGYSVSGMSYGPSSDIYKATSALVNALNNGNTAIPCPWGNYHHDTDVDEISIVNVTLDPDDNQSVIFSEFGTKYKLSLIPDGTVRAFIIKSDDLRDSIEYDRIFQEIVDSPEGSPVRMLTTFNFDDGTTYSSPTPEFEYLKNLRSKLVDMLTTGKGFSVYAPLTEHTINSEDKEILFSDISLYGTYELGFYAHGGYYKVLFDNAVTKATVSYEVKDVRDSIEFDKIFQEIIGSDPAYPFELDSMYFIETGTEYPSSDYRFEYMKKLMEKIAINNGPIYATKTVTSFDGKKEIVVVPVSNNVANTLTFEFAGDTYAIVFDNNITTATKMTCYKLKAKGDYYNYFEAFQIASGRSASSPFYLDKLNYAYEGYSYGTDSVYYSCVLKLIENTTGFDHIMGVWSKEPVAGIDEYILTEVAVDNVHYVLDFNIHGSRRSIKINPGTGFTCYLYPSEDQRDSIAFTEEFDDMMSPQVVNYRLKNTEFTLDGKVYMLGDPEYKMATKLSVRVPNGGTIMIPYDTTSLISYGFEDESIVVPVTRYDIQDGFELVFNQGGATKKLIINTVKQTATAVLIPPYDGKGDFVAYDKRFQELVGEHSTDVHLKNYPYEEGAGFELDTFQSPGDYILNLWKNVYMLDNYVVWGTWTTTHFDTAGTDIYPICVQMYCVSDGRRAIRFEAEGKLHEFEFNDDMSKVYCKYITEECKHDGERWTEEFEKLAGCTMDAPFYLNIPEWTVAGTEYELQPGVPNTPYNALNKLIASGKTEFLGTWNKVTINAEDEYILTHITVDSANKSLSFVVDGTTYKAVKENGIPIVTCYKISSDDKRDSEEFDKQFIALIGDDEYTLSDTYFKPEGNIYQSNTPTFKAALAIYNRINYSEVPYEATWSRNPFEDPLKDQIITVPVMFDNESDLTLGFSLGGFSYKFVFNESDPPSYVVAYKSKTTSGDYDVVYNEEFQSIAGQTVGDPVYLRDTPWPDGYEYVHNVGEFTNSAGFMAILNSGIDDIIGTWAVVNYQDYHQVSLKRSEIDGLPAYTFVHGSSIYRFRKVSDTKLAIQMKDISTDSVEYLRRFKEITQSDFLLSDLEYTWNGIPFAYGSPLYTMASKFMDAIVSIGQAGTSENVAAMGVWDVVESFSGAGTLDGEVICVPVSRDLEDLSGHTATFTIGDRVYKMVYTPNVEVVCYERRIETDSERYDRMWQKRCGPTRPEPVYLGDINFPEGTTNYPYGSTVYGQLYASIPDYAGANTKFKATWSHTVDVYASESEEYTFVDVTAQQYRYTFSRDGYQYTVRRQANYNLGVWVDKVPIGGGSCSYDDTIDLFYDLINDATKSYTLNVFKPGTYTDANYTNMRALAQGMQVGDALMCPFSKRTYTAPSGKTYNNYSLVTLMKASDNVVAFHLASYVYTFTINEGSMICRVTIPT